MRRIELCDMRLSVPRHYRDMSWRAVRISKRWPGTGKRAAHVPLWIKLAGQRARASMAGFRAMPNKNGRHFTILSPEMLDARRQGVPGRVMRGQPA